MDTINKISSAAKGPGKEILQNLIGVFMRDPVAAWSLAENLKNSPSAIRDEIFMECLEMYILNAYCFNEETHQFESKNLQSLAIALAEASPNPEADYDGEPEKLYEYAKRLIKLIDDCGTRQKAYYLACITRALLAKQIDTRKFFQLSRCIRSLTEEDLLFLREHIKEGGVPSESDYIDDYRALGLVYETEEGFAYSMRAFELKKYALCYEQHIVIPKSLPQRRKPLLFEEIPDNTIEEIVSNTFEDFGDEEA